MDQDSLKVLISIEKLLKGTSALTDGRKLPTTSADKARETSSQRAGREANRAFKATASNLKSTNDTITGLNKSLVGLNTEVGRTTSGFGSLNTQMAKFMTSLVPLETLREVEPREADDDCCAKLLKSMEGMWSSVTKLGTDFTADVGKVVQAGAAANTVLGQILASQLQGVAASNSVVQTGAAANTVLGQILAAQLQGVAASNSVRAAIQGLVLTAPPTTPAPPAVKVPAPTVPPPPAVKVPAPTVPPPPVVNVPAPTVNVAPPAVNVPAPTVNVAPPAVNVPAPTVNVAAPVVNVPAPVMTVTPPATPTPAPAPIRPTAPVNPATPALNSIMGRMIDNFSRNTTVMSGLTVVMSNLWKVVEKLTDDFMLLASAGMGSSQNLYEMSKFALLSGMSLQEYQETITKNISAASRSGSLEEFNRVITSSSSQLAKLGVYGADATRFQASLAQANTMMGVSQGNMTSAISSQVSVFDKLRKSTNMTADEFGKLVTQLSENEQVQKELVGLAPQQRAARQAELLSIATTGQKLGLTAQASEKLAEALIAQRGESVKNRFEQAGRIRQLGQLTGMGGEGERAAQIVMKGRAASAAELEELRGIAGRLDSASQGAYEQGSLGVQSALDYFQETLGSSNFGKVMQANRPAALAEDSGKVNQEAFGKHVDEFGQAVGSLTTLITGFTKSVGPGLLAALGAGMAVLFKGPLAAAMSAGLARFAPGAVKATSAAVGTGAAAGAKAPGMLSSIGGAISKLLSPISSLKAGLGGLVPTMVGAGQTAVQWAAGVPKALRGALASVATPVVMHGPKEALKIMFQQFGSTMMNGVRTTGTTILQGTRTTVSAMVSAGGSVLSSLSSVARAFAPAAMLIDGIMEAFTGKLALAMDPNGGVWSRVVGVVVAGVTALPQMIISMLSWVFGDAFMKPIQSVFDVVRTGIAGAVNGLALGIVSAVSWLTDMLPADSGLRKMVDAAKASLETSLQANADTINELGGVFGSENRKTLAEIGDANAKAAEDAKKKSDAATTKATAAAAKFNNVQYGTELTRAGVTADARAIIGEPQVQTPTPVNPGTVNNTEEAAAQQGNAQQSDQAVAALGGPEVLAALNAILAVMRENLVQEQRQAELAEQLVNGNRPAATFVPADVMAHRLLNQRYS